MTEDDSRDLKRNQDSWDSTDQPDETPSFRESLSAAARQAGIAKVQPGEAPSASALLAAIGGVRGLVESILPGLVFLFTYTITGQLLPSVLIPIGVAAIFVVARLVARTPATSAIAGVIGIGVSAALALLTGNVNDNFVPGLIINAVSLTVFVVSVLARWPLVGLIVALLTGDVGEWRKDPAKLRVAYLASGLWIGLFALRLGVQGPLYLAEQTSALAATKLVMGVPLYAAVLWVTWLLVRTAYSRPRPESDDNVSEGDSNVRSK